MDKAPLIREEHGEKEAASKWELFVEELKKVSYIAVPMVVVTVSQHLSRVTSMMMVGHLGELSLSGTAVATSLTNVSGFSLLFGLASALETLCGQAYGAEQYQKLGIYTYSAILCLLIVCIPISLLWIFMDKLLILIGQDPLISVVARKYAIWLIPTLVPYAILQSLIRYLQTQSLILPMLYSSVAALVFHVPVCWALVFKTKLGNAGAALAIGLSYWINVILLVIYVKYSSKCKKTRFSFSNIVLPSMKEFFSFAVPSAVMVCLEWWSCEIIVLLSGLLPNPQLETSVLSTCLLVASLHYFIPYSIGAAASTRVSNALGAGCSETAQVAVWAAIVLSVVEVIVACTILLCLRHVVGYAFSDVKEVVDYLDDITPLVCLLLTMDCIQAVLSGVARGSGWQHLGAYVNLGAFYLVGIPMASVLGFVLHLQGKGLWLGLNMGSIVQSFLLTLITTLTNWKKQASMAQQRIFEKRNTADETC
ncbi:protein DETOXIFICATION 3-like [Olea europaea var. sylvestris]|uniref:protein DETOXIFICATION 3-like n=1 Tax=Olea europaea var. sylvestris TaxID=158386 RepID=UPI000C1D6E86|nr:protein DETOXIFICATION 3-like [Olea europaea var. sylvestris]